MMNQHQALHPAQTPLSSSRAGATEANQPQEDFLVEFRDRQFLSGSDTCPSTLVVLSCTQAVESRAVSSCHFHQREKKHSLPQSVLGVYGSVSAGIQELMSPLQVNESRDSEPLKQTMKTKAFKWGDTIQERILMKLHSNLSLNKSAELSFWDFVSRGSEQDAQSSAGKLLHGAVDAAAPGDREEAIPTSSPALTGID
ncbi:hypothetical protein DV515_00007042 [Chloebia gouldiae]|uniref:Uncharacterized protein n=1 Tax=Chloebia gouldiae TaxID=44316 RepID=A0A3L8SKB4_CHLGU|nr:hypothetical protein DV515_00007042 [Chloebia gouldiae]